jgi:2-C-methyl-D-erythritol 4-phosphate cytidylyltransferase
VIAAAGSGERLGAGGPKAFVEVAGRPLIGWSLSAFGAAGSIAEIVVAAPAGEDERVKEIASAEGITEVQVVAGGRSRSESVAKALERVSSEIAVVHDAARPLVAAELIDSLVDRLAGDREAAGVVAAAPVTDTVKEASDGGRVERTLDRSRLWAVQTPQVFRAGALRDAVDSAGDLAEATDDAMLVEAAGGRVLLHEAPRENLKVTSEFDLRIAELLLREQR